MGNRGDQLSACLPGMTSRPEKSWALPGALLAGSVVAAITAAAFRAWIDAVQPEGDWITFSYALFHTLVVAVPVCAILAVAAVGSRRHFPAVMIVTLTAASLAVPLAAMADMIATIRG